MKASELRHKERATLVEEVKELRKQLETLKLQKATTQLENPKKILHVKRDLARVLTVLKEFEIKEAR
ncbi:MAG TPA: 50S ribosomal protein L29 [Bdellovibrionota bacterium]|nr:50S ribosomal protein L29 [Bdellovibrionota bacterium]